ncbi:MAG TPA: FtsQ-type POTRA domain-containing protein [Galbitalea sp.]|nr:FtsQ-type POTRA domain-containing protein [Galbitalea sp.]
MKRPEGFDPPPPPQGSVPRKPTRRVPAPQPKTTAQPELSPAASAGRSSRPATSAAQKVPAQRAERRAVRAEARRFTRGSRRRRLAMLSVTSVVVVVLAILAIAVFSPILALRTIDVEGVSAIKASTIRDALSNQLGTPLALLNDGKIRSELSSIILIRSYVTEIVPPNTLVVRIVERKAIGVLKVGATYRQVDPAGVTLATSSGPAGLPVIQIGDAGVDSAGFAAAIKVLLAMPASVLAEVGSIQATTLDNVSLTLSQGNHTVIWGSSSQSDLKAAALATLLKNANCANQPVLNVTAPLALACGPVQPTPTPRPTSTPAG